MFLRFWAAIESRTCVEFKIVVIILTKTIFIFCITAITKWETSLVCLSICTWFLHSQVELDIFPSLKCLVWKSEIYSISNLISSGYCRRKYIVLTENRKKNQVHYNILFKVWDKLEKLKFQVQLDRMCVLCRNVYLLIVFWKFWSIIFLNEE